ncbi:hypothetical protein M441DRAFT_31599 [Trichoderma asperellum CBS 433.97]|uniref:Uncharacterized protein n=1 Tax=Trichoderma asperellum (strain ATCC 204424 / CBS 433.97 / NBRC 101777) TaxID=1042311 RepID=A0A2T3YT72_TRIA4|nr:hypothetical protein M441DRAFT_31599 [Trichoderma asperellum CBS 433.97]PTB35696.1 hypothetical protein M441DRAFT_31599 [Trichoderma asperellum CBS 433.97]
MSNNTFTFKLDPSSLPQLTSRGDNYAKWKAAWTIAFRPPFSPNGPKRITGYGDYVCGAPRHRHAGDNSSISTPSMDNLTRPL